MTMMTNVGFKFKRQKAYEDYLFKKDNQHRDQLCCACSMNVCLSQLNKQIWPQSEAKPFEWRWLPGENITKNFEPFLSKAIDFWIEKSHKNPDWENEHERSNWRYEEVAWFKDTRIDPLPRMKKMTFDKIFPDSEIDFEDDPKLKGLMTIPLRVMMHCSCT